MYKPFEQLVNLITPFVNSRLQFIQYFGLKDEEYRTRNCDEI